jgi:hypothetical protein
MKDLGALADRRRFALGDKVEKAAQCCEATVARTDRGPALDLSVLQEGGHFGSRELGQRNARNGALVANGDKAKEQAPGITIRTYRVSRDVALLHKPLVEKGM